MSCTTRIGLWMLAAGLVAAVAFLGLSATGGGPDIGLGFVILLGAFLAVAGGIVAAVGAVTQRLNRSS